MPYVLKNTRRIRVHRPRMKPSGGCQSFCFGFQGKVGGVGGWGQGDGRMWMGRGRGKLQVRSSVYISPAKEPADCSVIHTGKQAQNHIIHSLYLSAHFMYTICCLTNTKVHTKRPAAKLISTPPLSCVCPIRRHIITLYMIILLNLTRIKQASHKEHIYMLMCRQYSTER